MSNSIVDLLEAYPLPEQKEKPPYKIYCDMDGDLRSGLKVHRSIYMPIYMGCRL